MCIDILRNPAGAIVKAKKSRNMNKTLLALIEASVLLAIASAIVVIKTGAYSQLAYTIALASAVTIFVMVLVLSLIMGYVLKIIATTLGSTGRYYDGLTVFAYSLIPMSASIFLGAIFALVPGGAIISVIALALGFASGLSLLYRGVKEMFKTDMVTAFVAVSVLILVIFIAASGSLGLTALTRLSSFLPAV